MHGGRGGAPTMQVVDEATYVSPKTMDACVLPQSEGAPGPTIYISSATIAANNPYMQIINRCTRARARTREAWAAPSNAGVDAEELRDPADIVDVIAVEMVCAMCFFEKRIRQCIHRANFLPPQKKVSTNNEGLYSSTAAFEQENLNLIGTDVEPLLRASDVNNVFLDMSRFVSHETLASLRRFVLVMDPSGGSSTSSETGLCLMAVIHGKPVLAGIDSRFTTEDFEYRQFVCSFVDATIDRYKPEARALGSSTNTNTTLVHKPPPRFKENDVGNAAFSEGYFTSAWAVIADRLTTNQFYHSEALISDLKDNEDPDVPLEIMFQCENNTAFVAGDVARELQKRYAHRKDVVIHQPFATRRTGYNSAATGAAHVIYGIRTDGSLKASYGFSVRSNLPNLLFARHPITADQRPRGDHGYTPAFRSEALRSIRGACVSFSGTGAMREAANSFVALLAGVPRNILDEICQGRNDSSLSSDIIAKLLELPAVNEHLRTSAVVAYCKLWHQLILARREFTPSGKETCGGKMSGEPDDNFIILGLALTVVFNLQGSDNIDLDFRKRFLSDGKLPPPYEDVPVGA